MKASIIRQGDVLLVPVKSLPIGAKEIPLDKGRIVLAYGEVTGHAHAIDDHVLITEESLRAADEIADAAIARAVRACADVRGRRRPVPCGQWSRDHSARRTFTCTRSAGHLRASYAK